MNSFLVFGLAILGALSNEFLSWYRLRQPQRFLKPVYFLVSLVTACVFGFAAALVLLTLESGEPPPLLSFYVGFTMPYIMRELLKASLTSRSVVEEQSSK